MMSQSRCKTKIGFVELGFVEPHEVHLGPLLKPAWVPLDGISSLWCVDHTLQLGVISKLAESVYNPAVDVIEDIKRSWH